MSDQPAYEGTVVVLDDEPLMLRTTVDLLRGRGIRALPAADTAMLDALLERERPDLILLDIMIEGRALGYDICRTLKGNPATRSIPVIFMSGLSDMSRVVQGFDVGAVDYVTKPVRAQELRARVITHLSLARAKRELEERVRARTIDLERTNEALRHEVARRKAAQVLLREHAERLDLLREIERGILSAESPETVAQAALTGMRHLVSDQWTAVVLFDEGLREARAIATEDMTGAVSCTQIEAEHVSLADWQDVIGELRHGQVVTITDLDARGVQGRTLVAMGSGSLVCLPLEAQERLLGALCLGMTVGDGATAEQIGVAHQVARPLAIAIQQAEMQRQIRRQNRELEQRVADRTRELRAMYEVAAAGSESPTLDDLLRRALESAMALVGCSMGSIHLLSSDAVPVLRAALRIPSDLPTNPSPDCIRRLLVEQEGSRCCPERPLSCREEGVGPRLVHCGCVAMRVAGRALGVLRVCREAPAVALDAREMLLLRTIADHVGAAAEAAQLRERAERAVLIEERQRLARELHDSVTQSLYSAMLLAAGGRMAAEHHDLPQTIQVLGRVQEVTQQALKEMRLLVYELRPPILEAEGLVGALQRRLDAVETRSGMSARLFVEQLIEMSAQQEEALFRIVSEALNNSLKHAEASAIEVRIAVEGSWLVAEAVDDGRGFDVSALSEQGGMGHVSMRERAERLGGTLTIESEPGTGTCVTARLPLAPRSA